MSSAVVNQQQILRLRVRRHAYEQAAVSKQLAHVAQVAQNQRLHGPGHELAEQMSAQQAMATRHEAASRPGWRIFVVASVLAGMFLVAVEQAPHDAHWNVLLLVAGAIVAGLVVWLLRYGVHGIHRRAARRPRAAASDVSTRIGCGNQDCRLQPCAGYRTAADRGSDPVAVDGQPAGPVWVELGLTRSVPRARTSMPRPRHRVSH
jgi:hypothetical protein